MGIGIEFSNFTDFNSIFIEFGNEFCTLIFQIFNFKIFRNYVNRNFFILRKLFKLDLFFTALLMGIEFSNFANSIFLGFGNEFCTLIFEFPISDFSEIMWIEIIFFSEIFPIWIFFYSSFVLPFFLRKKFSTHVSLRSPSFRISLNRGPPNKLLEFKT